MQMLVVHDIDGKLSQDAMDKLNNEIKISPLIDYPQMRYGFQHFYHQTVTKTDKFEQFDGKKRVYNIINYIEPVIEDYPESLSNIFKINGKRGIYKIIECLSLFELVNAKKNITLHIGNNGYQHAEGTELFCKKYYPTSTSTHSIYDSEKSENPTIKQLKNISSKYTLITINQKIKEKKIIYDNISEQTLFPYIFDKIALSLGKLEKDGSIIIKMYDTFTGTTIKLLLLVKSLFDKMYVYKPLSGKFSNPEKFIVFKKFNGENKHLSELLGKINKKIESLNGNNLIDFCTNIDPPREFTVGMIKANNDIANYQYNITNKMLVFIERQNYRGEEYNKNKGNQIALTKKWMEIFYPEEYKNRGILESAIKFNEKDIKYLNDKLIF